MAFLSLGLNIDEPRTIEQTPTACPEQELSDDILSDEGPVLDSVPALEDRDYDVKFSELTPGIDELRKKILEGITPDFRFAPTNGQLRNEFPSLPASQSTSHSAAKSDDLSTPLTPEILWSMMDGLPNMGKNAITPPASHALAAVSGAGISALATRSDI